MKRKTFVLLCLTTVGQIFPLSAKESVQKDMFGQETKTSDGTKKNYSKESFQSLKALGVGEPNAFDPMASLRSAEAEATAVKNKLEPKMDLLYTLMGSSIGRNSMHSVDIDADGQLEIICTASTSTFGAGNYWYVLKRDTTSNQWSPTWASKTGSGTINVLEVSDYDSDGKLEILLGCSDGTLDIYSATKLTRSKSIKPTSESIRSLVVADADNDGVNEIVLASDNNTTLLSTSTLAKEHVVPKGGSAVRVGKLEDNGWNEIVLSSGFVYLVKDSVQSQVWNFNTSGGSYLELSDIDGDLKQEIVLAQSWYNIYVYDVDSKTNKYTLTTSLDINSLLLTDVNGDGKDEILYGDGQWGSVHCYNAVTKSKLWSVKNPEHGVAAINFADVNNDGLMELIWTAGWTSTGSDYLYIYNVRDSKQIWRSEDVNGPFYALATGDVDEDGNDEIVATSFQSESGYDSGILFIFDAKTNRLKWKSDGNFFRNTWEGVYTADISDVDNDGKNEIIVATDQLYDGQLWIVNGKTHVIESSHLFDTGGFRALAVEDVDNDGQKEIITTDNSKLYVINPITWVIKGSVTCSPSYGSVPAIRCADVNGDGFKEILLCSNSLSIINGRDYSSWSSTTTGYTCLDVFDWNNDGLSDIVVGTSAGMIQVYDGTSRSILTQSQPEPASLTAIRGFRTGQNVYFIYSCNGAINVFQNASNCSSSGSLGSYVGAAESLKLYNQKPNSTELLIGTATSIYRMYLNFISVSADSLTFGSDSNGSKSVSISTGESWSISGCPDWLNLSSSSGTGASTIVLAANQNSSVNNRLAMLVVNAGSAVPSSIVVVQKGVPPVLTVNQDSITMKAAESLTKKIMVSGNVSWTAVSDKSWLYVVKSDGVGNDSIQLIAQVNLSMVPREAVVTITGQYSIIRKVKVVQEAGKPTLLIYETKLPVSYLAGSTVLMNITSNVDWTVSSDQAWIRFNKTVGSGNSYVRIYAEGNPFVTARSAQITVTGTGLSPQTVEVVQEPAPPVLKADLTLSKISSANEEHSFEVLSNLKWRILNNQDWLRISRDTGTLNAKIVMTAQPNVSGEIRAATLLLLSDDMEPFIVNVLQEETAEMTQKDLTSLQLCSNDFSSELILRSLMYNANVSIYDINGKMIWTKNCTSTSESIDISSYPKGIYTVKYRDGKTVMTSKFIKR